MRFLGWVMRDFLSSLHRTSFSRGSIYLPPHAGTFLASHSSTPKVKQLLQWRDCCFTGVKCVADASVLGISCVGYSVFFLLRWTDITMHCFPLVWNMTKAAFLYQIVKLNSRAEIMFRLLQDRKIGVMDLALYTRKISPATFTGASTFICQGLRQSSPG